MEPNSILHYDKSNIDKGYIFQKVGIKYNLEITSIKDNVREWAEDEKTQKR
jgi:hypothetical protein